MAGLELYSFRAIAAGSTLDIRLDKVHCQPCTSCRLYVFCCRASGVKEGSSMLNLGLTMSWAMAGFCAGRDHFESLHLLYPSPLLGPAINQREARGNFSTADDPQSYTLDWKSSCHWVH